MEMLQSSSVPKLPSEFNLFLFSPINGEQTGMPVSVLSALARSGLDPWDEAAKLARLPHKAATESLASTIASLRGSSSLAFDQTGVAERLVALLPKCEALQLQRSEDRPAAVTKGDRDVVVFAIVISGLLMAFAFTHQGVARSSPADAAKRTHASLSEHLPAPSKQDRSSK